MNIIPYFPSPIAEWVTENPFDLKDYCLEIKEKYPVILDNGWIHAPYNTVSAGKTKYNAIKDPKFSELNQWVQECVDEFNDEVGFESMYPNDMWFNVYEKGDYTQSHHHKPAAVSCAYFLKAKWYDSPFVFTYSGKRISPKEGRYVLFPSHLKHHVPKHRFNHKRMTLSANWSCKVK